MERTPDVAAAGAPWRSTSRLPFTMSGLLPHRRRLVDEMHAHRMPEDTTFDASLVLGELVTNALRHAAPLEDGSVAVTWGAWDGFVHVEVTDGGGETAPRAGSVPSVSTHGRGLAIVDAVSAAWGVRTDGDASTVWASIPVTDQPKP